MTAFSDMADALFDDPNQAVDAVYAPPSPPGGSSTAVRLMLRKPEEVAQLLQTGAVAEQALGSIRVAELADCRENGVLVIALPAGGTLTRQVKAPRRDERGLVWRFSLKPAPP